ncbi:MAG TPA: cupin domain-containing protein [Candidatus Eisenbacteria bacterium]|nr:cupin domain-containing protein [Candidatus Eisenbacteria bacterium]
MKHLRVVAPVLFLGAALVAAAIAADTPAPQAKPNVKNLLQTALDEEFTPGREILVDMVEVPPHGELERHWHPGEEFHYYLDGDARIEIDGEPAIEGKPGTVGHVPYKKRHRAIAGEKGAKVLVFRVHTKGEPTRYVDEKHEEKR